MRVENLQLDKFILINQIQEVTNPIFLNPDRTATEDGLFSYSIFGIPGSKERKCNFGYIKLGVKVLHPFFYIILTQMDRKIKQCIEGSEYFNIKNGNLVKVDEKTDEKGFTGCVWLYKHFKEIKFENGSSDLRNTKIDLINKTNIDDIFVDKWLVIPAFYRDMDFSKVESGHIEAGEENEMYVKLINISSFIKKFTSYDNFMATLSISKLQNCLVEIYKYFIQKPAGKTGFIKRFLISKNFDFSTRSVISNSKYTYAERPEDVSVKIGEFGVPLHLLCTDYYPFVVKNIREFLSGVIPENRANMYFGHSSEYKPQKTSIQFTLENLTDDKIHAMISAYQRSWEHRWDELKLIQEDGKALPLYIFKDQINRPFTITDLLFIAVTYSIRDKYLWNTRFPIESMHSTLPTKPVILTTNEVETKDFSPLSLGKITNYPKYGCNEWRDATVLDNSKTTILGADFDGDTMSEIPVFSQEGNQVSKDLMSSKILYINIAGKPINTITNEAHFSLYMISKDV